MLLIRKNTRTEPARPTHVLHWVPSFLDDDGRGYWALQDTDAYDAGLEPADSPESQGLPPIDADRETLTAWATEETGYPVVLEKGGEDAITFVSLRPPALHRGQAPVWYVWPARQP